MIVGKRQITVSKPKQIANLNLKITNKDFVKRSREGFTKTIPLIYRHGTIALGSFGYNLRDVISSSKARENLSHARGIILKIWNTAIVTPTLWMGNKIRGLLPEF
ncbi:MAG: hypothetical protein A2W52_02860 [Candidatus Taylorbacteria bacterium RIFCSPHIGHO2_02_49_25]|uniref:Uncharacterized protein n=1 Tax=Candidatus Taylorbacteria bacterium RIFCSPHIGHO2_02_49_25 TaxID=1802305 RepID=A0A1G2MII2_9BACT|nr:MAG: hypothetical protein UY62_C0040G0009 [Parcubacteria group bacterium GW2011_GWF2_50_9]OHA21071.1 MAG: hypothetical protein A2759_00085 [Candidatus Taylorbacteria bacterium RIFCSPHIGHO2_01_FULL_49_60]OHA23678.1 MAG: hypothetical protein A2W52_02860 [Candidatus Taylorbacteria bacterium RIFCSPHIGHO2_02_49_25]OHA35755.1 MAG: hypothetical protein A3B27_02300 [Candidatus Taylorbacteria bacterium RIFCSPLOWO2_01_FULL_50_130]OHA37157.1 MAG: hypothetical protein A2W65_02415 [Candidatus Taylorbacte